jgi:hypothetical protein
MVEAYVDALEMQRLPLRKAFYTSRSIGIHRKMPEMQKHFVSGPPVNRARIHQKFSPPV